MKYTIIKQNKNYLLKKESNTLIFKKLVPFTKDIKHKVVKISCGNHSAAITSEGELFLWGTGAFGTFLIPHKINFEDSLIVDAEVGGCFGIALDARGRMFSWGTNTSGELGLGDFEPRNKPTQIDSLLNNNIKRIFCGTGFTFALGETRINSYSSRKVMVKNLPKTDKDNILKQVAINKSPAVFEPREPLINSPSNHSSIQSLIISLRKERDFFESCLKEERMEREKIESEFLQVKKQHLSSDLEVKRLSNELEEKYLLLNNAMKNEEILEEKEIMYQQLLESHEKVTKENERLLQLVHESEINSQNMLMDLELAHKDVATLKAKIGAEDICYLKQIEIHRQNLANLEEKYLDLQDRELKYQQEIQELHNTYEEKCDISSKTISELKQTVISLEEKLNSKNKELDTVREGINKTATLLDYSEKELMNREIQATNFKEEIEKLKAEIQNRQGKIDELIGIQYNTSKQLEESLADNQHYAELLQHQESEKVDEGINTSRVFSEERNSDNMPIIHILSPMGIGSGRNNFLDPPTQSAITEEGKKKKGIFRTQYIEKSMAEDSPLIDDKISQLLQRYDSKSQVSVRSQRNYNTLSSRKYRKKDFESEYSQFNSKLSEVKRKVAQIRTSFQ